MARMRRPSMGDRMDKAQQKRDWPKGSIAERLAKIDTAEYEKQVRVEKAKAEAKQKYRDSKAEKEHRKRGKKLGLNPSLCWRVERCVLT